MIYVSSSLGPLPLLDGEFELGARLGEGGGGSVFEATQISLQRPVAVKRLHAWRTKGAEARFREEATLMGRVAHPNIVPVLMHGHLDGAPALVMERVDGFDLGAVLRQLQRDPAPASALKLARTLGSEALPWPAATPWWKVAASLAAQVGRALDHAHRCGVLHRDIKPSNVLLSKSGVAQLTDFGIALPEHQGRTEAQLQDPRREATSGNLAYCSPEELDGHASTARSDTFSLGLVARELVSLKPSYPDHDESIAARMLAIAEGRTRPLDRHLPSDLRAVLDTAVSHDPRDRYASADDFARDLENACAGRAVSVAPETRGRRYRRWWSRHGVVTMALAGLGALLIGVPTVIQGTRLAAARQVQASARAARGHLELAVDGIGDLLVNVTAASLKGEANAEAQRTALLATGAQLGRDLAGTLSASLPMEIRSSASASPSGSEEEEEVAKRIQTLRARALTDLIEAERKLGHFDKARAHIAELRSFQHLVPDGAVHHLDTRLQLHEVIMFLAEGELAASEALAAEALNEIEELDARDEKLKRFRASLWNARVEAALAGSDTQTAITYGEEAVEVGRAWLEEADSNAEASIELGRVLSNYGAALIDSGRAEDASAPTREALKLVRSQPATTRTESIEAILWNNIGAIETTRGQLAEALIAEQRALELQKGQLSADPRSSVKRFVVARTHFRIGVLHLSQGSERAELETHFGRAVEGVQALCEGPNPTWQQYSLLAQAEFQNGMLSFGTKDYEEAHGRFGRSVTAFANAEELVADHPTLLPTRLAVWKYYAAVTLNVEGEAGVGVLLRYRDEFPLDAQVQRNVASMLCKLGQIALGSDDGAREETLSRVAEYHARSLECLGTAADLGGLSLELLETHATWKPLHDLPGYGELAQRLR